MNHKLYKENNPQANEWADKWSRRLARCGIVQGIQRRNVGRQVERDDDAETYRLYFVE